VRAEKVRKYGGALGGERGMTRRNEVVGQKAISQRFSDGIDPLRIQEKVGESQGRKKTMDKVGGRLGNTTSVRNIRPERNRCQSGRGEKSGGGHPYHEASHKI